MLSLPPGKARVLMVLLQSRQQSCSREEEERKVTPRRFLESRTVFSNSVSSSEKLTLLECRDCSEKSMEEVLPVVTAPQ